MATTVYDRMQTTTSRVAEGNAMKPDLAKLFYMYNTGVLPVPTPEQKVSDYIHVLMSTETLVANGEKKALSSVFSYNELVEFSKRIILCTRIDTADLDGLRSILKEIIKELT
jgi:hypothetical protein